MGTIKEDFEFLANWWKKDTRFLSNPDQICNHLAYREVIKFGHNIIPYILEDLKAEDHLWFQALEELTGYHPYIPDSERGDIVYIRSLWLDWGREKGIID